MEYNERATPQIAAEAFPQMPAPAAAATSPFHFHDFLNGNDQMDVLNGNKDLPPQPQLEHPHPDPAADVATDEPLPQFSNDLHLNQFQFPAPAADFPGWGIYPPPLLV